MRCFVTGAAGFIGKLLVNRLVKEGYEVRALIHKTKPKHCEKKVEYVTGNITDSSSVKSLIKDVDVVFHCAAYVKDYGPKEIFYKVNVEGTKNLAEACEKVGIKKFVFLSHIRYESEKSSGHYSKTKALAEQYLLEKYKQNKFPAVIIRPGNVYGPSATTWVLRPLEAIQKNRISLINNGNGIFLHTYIDNLVDALVSAIKSPEAVGETIDITDGDNKTNWGEYLNSLAKIAGKSEIKRNMSKKMALFVSKLMMALNKVFRIDPWVTPMAVKIFTNQQTVSIEKAKTLLEYEPRVGFKKGMNEVEKWLKEEGHI